MHTCSYDSQYDDPADVMEGSLVGVQRQKYTGSPKIKRKVEPETNLYSEPVRRTKKKRPPSDDEAEVRAASINMLYTQGMHSHGRKIACINITSEIFYRWNFPYPR